MGAAYPCRQHSRFLGGGGLWVKGGLDTHSGDEKIGHSRRGTPLAPFAPATRTTGGSTSFLLRTLIVMSLCLAACSGSSSQARTSSPKGSDSEHPTLDDFFAGRYQRLLERCQQWLAQGAVTDEIKVCITVFPAVALLQGNRRADVVAGTESLGHAEDLPVLEPIPDLLRAERHDRSVQRHVHRGATRSKPPVVVPWIDEDPVAVASERRPELLDVGQVCYPGPMNPGSYGRCLRLVSVLAFRGTFGRASPSASRGTPHRRAASRIPSSSVASGSPSRMARSR